MTNVGIHDASNELGWVINYPGNECGVQLETLPSSLCTLRILLNNGARGSDDAHLKIFTELRVRGVALSCN